MRVFPDTAAGQALKVALIFTAVATVVLGAAAFAVDLSATRQVTVDEAGRVEKAVRALADGDLAAQKATGVVVPDAVGGPPGRSTIVTLPGDIGKQGGLVAPTGAGIKAFGLRVVAWRIAADGSATPVTPATPDLPAGASGVTATTKIGIDGQGFLAAGASGSAGRYVAAISLDAAQTSSQPFQAYALRLFPLAVLVIFGLALLAGRAAAAPIERSRRRQLEFAADASHELRTPLAVIQAEASLALSRPRTADDYTRSMGRIAGESEKLKRLVDDLLFLARADAERVVTDGPPQPLGAVAAATVERFRPVAGARSLELSVTGADVDGGVAAPDGWVDRVAAILVDNACRYTPEGGSVSVSVVSAPGHVELAVEDSGPGIPEAERQRVFDRFHRAADGPDGAGLGLAIADAIVRRTRGRWSVGTSALGGVAIRVTWPAA